jgi:hypothetical protein
MKANKDKTISVKDFTLHSKKGNVHWPESDGGAIIAEASEVKAVVNRVKALIKRGKEETIKLSYDGGTAVSFNQNEQIVAIGCQEFTFEEILKIGKQIGVK